jgi:hypothetical protein
MITHISWEPSVANKDRIIRRLPETPFDCPKLDPGDTMSLDMGRPKGNRILIPIKVVRVSLSTGWDVVNNVRQAKIRDVEQYLYVEPVVIEEPEQPE